MCSVVLPLLPSKLGGQGSNLGWTSTQGLEQKNEEKRLSCTLTSVNGKSFASSRIRTSSHIGNFSLAILKSNLYKSSFLNCQVCIRWVHINN